MCLIVLDGVFIITTQIPVMLSVLSNSYDEKEPIIRHASKWQW